MKKNILIIFLSVAVLTVGIFFLFFRQTGVRNQVCFESHCFDVELALTPEERAKGLMFREKLGQNEGMLFVFQDESNYSFWMKNTLIPLDIIWLDKEREVVFMSKNVQPCRVDSCPPINPLVSALYVLELNAGIADKIGLITGAKMR